MKYLKFLLILVALFLGHSCGLRVDLFEIATSVPEMQIKSGPLLLPNNTGRYNFGDVSIFSSKYTPFSIENSGDAKLRITGISFSANYRFVHYSRFYY